MKKVAAVLTALLLLGQPAAAECLITGEAYRIGASAAVVIDAESGEVLFAQEPHRRLPMASTTKIMTAWLALEQPDLYQEFTVDANALQVEGSSMGLQAGDTVTLYALAVGMLLASGNDAAGGAAVRICGSTQAFAKEMNRRASSLGMNNTNFVTPSGLDADEHYSTAYDHRLMNHNRLLSLYENTIGVKTGFTKKAGRCLVSAAQQDGVRLICVTLNCPDDWNTHTTLYERYFSLTESRPLIMDSITLPVVGGAQTVLRATVQGQPTYTAIKGAEWDIVRTVYLDRAFCYAPVAAGQRLGQVVWTRRGRVIGTALLTAAADVPAAEHPHAWWQFWKKG